MEAIPKPKPYWLTNSDFEAKFERSIGRYQFGERIIRANFTPAMIDAFAKSRGNFSRHLVTFEWLRINTGFYWRETLRAFLQTTAFRSLNAMEQEMIVREFRRVREHANKSPYSAEYLVGSFESNLGQVIHWSPANLNFPNYKSVLAGMKVEQLPALLRSIPRRPDQSLINDTH